MCVVGVWVCGRVAAAAGLCGMFGGRREEIICNNAQVEYMFLAKVFSTHTVPRAGTFPASSNDFSH